MLEFNAGATQPLPDAPWYETASEQPLSGDYPTQLDGLPTHLGWESSPATQAIRAAQKQQEAAAAAQPTIVANRTPIAATITVSVACASQESRLTHFPPPDTVTHYPSLGVAALERRLAPACRVWLVARCLDRDGRGWLDLDEVRERLSGNGSELRLFGWRRLRQVLQLGNGRFWHWDRGNGRLWLFGAARLAVKLQVAHLEGQPVSLPLAALTDGMGVFKAHLYAAWHSGRRENKPISRAAQAVMLGVPERTQRHYCRVAEVRRQANLVIGEKYSQEKFEEQLWQRGRAAFVFVDGNGRQGPKNGRYIARQLPNSYRGPHETAVKGRVRKINQQLKDLVDIRARGERW